MQQEFIEFKNQIKTIKLNTEKNLNLFKNNFNENDLEKPKIKLSLEKQKVFNLYLDEIIQKFDNNVINETNYLSEEEKFKFMYSNHITSLKKISNDILLDITINKLMDDLVIYNLDEIQLENIKDFVTGYFESKPVNKENLLSIYAYIKENYLEKTQFK